MAIKYNTGNIPEPLKFLFISIIVSITYYLSAQFGLRLSFKPDYIAALWPPNAVLLAALFLSKTRNWIWFLIAVIPAELAADLPAGISLKMSIGFILADWIEVLTAALLFRKFSSACPDFSSIRQISLFICCCVISASFVAAFFGALATGLEQAGPHYLTRWTRWFIGDGLTHLLITPFIVLWLRKANEPHGATRRPYIYYFELLLLITLLLITGYLSLYGSVEKQDSFPAILYAPLPVLLWAAVRFGPRGIYTSSLFIAIVCIWFGAKGTGPFSGRSPAENVLNLQLYLIIAVTPLLFLSALIEEQKNVNRQLKSSEEKFRTLTDASPMAVSIIQNNRYRYVNESWEKLTGYSKKEALTLNPLMLVHPDMREQVRKNAAKRLKGKQVATRYEMKGISKKGMLVWYDFSVAVIQYDNRPALLCLKSDITDRKNAENLLKNREEQYRSLFENNISIILIIDPDNNYIIDANPSACSFYGYSKAEITKMKISDINILSEEEIRKEVEKVVTAKKNYFNFRHRLSTGEIRDVEVFSGPITINDRALICSIIHDISKRKAAQKEREELINELQTALNELKTLRGIIPICASCKNIRDDKGYWQHVESYISSHSEAEFSHSMCPDCSEKFYGDQEWFKKSKNKRS